MHIYIYIYIYILSLICLLAVTSDRGSARVLPLFGPSWLVRAKDIRSLGIRVQGLGFRALGL